MAKTKERSGEEFYRGKLREANKKIRQLERRIKDLERHAHIFVKNQDEEIETDNENTYPKFNKELCQACGKGKLEVIDIIGRIFQVCQLCGDRKKIS